MIPSFSMGIHNAVVNGVVIYDQPTAITFVSSQSDLGKIENVTPGDLAATYGFGTIWQYDGTQWQEVQA